jgi:hypothetical protein
MTSSLHRDPRRLGIATGAVVVGYALFLGAIRAGLIPVAGSDAGDVGPPDADLGALWLTVALALPGLIAGIAAIRRSGPLLVTAGVLCLGQASIAFSGVTLPFIAPGIYLIVLGVRTAAGAHHGREIIAGLCIFVLVAASWVTALGLTETRCWVATRGMDDQLVYTDVPEAETAVLDGSQVAAGCDGGSPTTAGLALGFVFAVSALALTAWGTRPDPVGSAPPTPA